MREIMTVLGSIDAGQLGFCQCHEHILMSKGTSYSINPALCIDDIGKSLAEVILYKEAGGCAFIEAQPGGCNRMPGGLAYISGESGVHIIASTGFHKLMFYPEDHWIRQASRKFMADFFTDELTNGMYTDIDRTFQSERTAHRAGIIKTALDTEGLTPRYRTLFEAAADASIATDKNIMIHVEQNADPLELLAFLTNMGVPAKNLIFCHMDRALSDIDIHKKVLDAGAYLEFDTIGRFKYHSDEHEISIFRTLIGAGYLNKLLFSLDTTRARLKSYTQDAIGLDYILTVFLDKMRMAGISEEQIYAITHTNCIHSLTD